MWMSCCRYNLQASTSLWLLKSPRATIESTKPNKCWGLKVTVQAVMLYNKTHESKWSPISMADLKGGHRDYSIKGVQNLSIDTKKALPNYLATVIVSSLSPLSKAWKIAMLFRDYCSRLLYFEWQSRVIFIAANGTGCWLARRQTQGKQTTVPMNKQSSAPD